MTAIGNYEIVTINHTVVSADIVGGYFQWNPGTAAPSGKVVIGAGFYTDLTDSTVYLRSSYPTSNGTNWEFQLQGLDIGDVFIAYFICAQMGQ